MAVGLDVLCPCFSQLSVSKYLGIDPSSLSIEYCNRTFTDVEDCHVQFEIGEARLLGKKYPGRFAGFMMAAVLMHIPRADIAVVLSSIRKSLKDGASGFFSTPLGHEDDGDLEFVNKQGIEISRYTEKELVESFIATGFKFKRIIDLDCMILGHVVAI